MLVCIFMLYTWGVPANAGELNHGDLTGDGEVKVSDALIVLRSVSGLVDLDEEQKSVGDVNQDGTVDVTDAIFILCHVVGLVDSLPVDENTEVPMDVDHEIPLEEEAIHGIYYGDSKSAVIDALGEPEREDVSRYGFEWFIYNQDYSNYVQVGIEDEKVVALYTNTGSWELSGSIGIGSTYDAVEKEFGEVEDGLEESWTYPRGDDTTIPEEVGEKYYITFFFDTFEEQVTSVKLIDKAIKNEVRRHPEPCLERRDSFEKQVFDLANAVRVREGEDPFEWCEDVALVAREHSKDMAERDFFSHDNPDGEDPFDRMENAGISFSSGAENIAYGYSNAVKVHEAWMNSKGHRRNILRDNDRLGVGVYMDEDSYTPYYTQKFYTP